MLLYEGLEPFGIGLAWHRSNGAAVVFDWYSFVIHFNFFVQVEILKVIDDAHVYHLLPWQVPVAVGRGGVTGYFGKEFDDEKERIVHQVVLGKESAILWDCLVYGTERVPVKGYQIEVFVDFDEV